MKVKFFYLNGTAWGINWPALGLRITQTGEVFINGQLPENKTAAMVSGIDGKLVGWDLAPHNDPFPRLLNTDVFDVVHVEYPAAAFPMSASIDQGAANVISLIQKLPVGQPFALGGYSQGAAAMSTVYNELRYGTLTSREPYFIGATMFGNPRRQINHRGEIGGTWSGLWYDESATTGGGGSFPAAGNYARLTGSEDWWCEFAYPGDIFTCNGTDSTGADWTSGNEAILNLSVAQIISWFAAGSVPDIIDTATQAITLGGAPLTVTDGAGTTVEVTGNGHVAYPFLPPYGVATSDTCYQVALSYLEAQAKSWATAPILNPNAGWSTVLLPPSV